MAPKPVPPFADAATIAAMLHLPGEDLVGLWSSQDIDFPKPFQTVNGLLWSRREVRQWARRWGWRE